MMKQFYLVTALSALFLLAGLTLCHAGGAFIDHSGDEGEWVGPSARSMPDSNYNNNYSVRGNVNPYTGRAGTREPTWGGVEPSRGGIRY